MAVELVEAAAQMPRGRGERLPVPGVAVLEALAGRNHHLTAEQVVVDLPAAHTGTGPDRPAGHDSLRSATSKGRSHGFS